jgi:hypothetical protein
MASVSRTVQTVRNLIDADNYVGGIYRMDYGSAVVLTDDDTKNRAGGIPMGMFLLAYEDEGMGSDPDADTYHEVILLRVRGTKPLPNEDALTQTRLAVVQEAADSRRSFNEVVDPTTRRRLEMCAFDCEVLGTFYQLDPESDIEFGSDQDNVMSGTRYRVYSPTKEVLSWLASYPETAPNLDLPPESLVLGTVRFASTRHRAVRSDRADAQVTVQVSDFISRKTAVFGMTRTGKSNTIKTLVTAVRKYSSTHDFPIGQLIFDPQGEYANPNQADGTGLKYLGGPEAVRIYRAGADGTDPQVLPLEFNFFDIKNLDYVVNFINQKIAQSGNTAAYAKKFTSIRWDVLRNGTFSEQAAWSRGLVGLYGLLGMCRFNGPSIIDSERGWVSLRFRWRKAIFDGFTAAYPNTTVREEDRGIYSVQTPLDAQMVTNFMSQFEDEGHWLQSETTGGDTPFKFICEVLDKSSVQADIRTLVDFHNPDSTEQVENRVWDDMFNGRVSIVDLSFGSNEVGRLMSSSIVTKMLSNANERFRDNLNPVYMQIVVEEAHNLFERNGNADPATDPWLRLAKEAAKYKMGLVYATQEVTSVDKRILSNTSNWLVAHLNSVKETTELSDYYSYKTWTESLRRCEDVGFLRMKTYSGKYIVPVQVKVFNHDMINEARRASGLPDLPPAQ